MADGFCIDLLGPLTVRHDRVPLSPGPIRQQAMLAVLALHANQVTSAEQLLDLVWDENPPSSGLRVIPTYVYRIRQTLPPEVALERTTGGYVLRLPPGALDIDRFESAMKAAEQAEDPSLYRDALALFRGEPLSGLPGNYLAGQRRRLTERRDDALSGRLGLELGAGRFADVVPELSALVAERPLDERFAAQLMTALFHSGRRAEALETYARTRSLLVDELGVEPGQGLQAVHQLLLRDLAEPASGRDELPYSGATFIGRTAELDAVVKALAPDTRGAPPVVAIDGMAGLGKTALAVQAGRRVAAQYPDGQLFVDLHGHTPGREPLGVDHAVDHLLRGIGVPAEKLPCDPAEREALWRSETAGLRLLIVLDNAPDTRAILPLLPGAPTCAVLVTSRRQLTSLGSSLRLGLDLLADDEAAALLTELVGAERVAAVDAVDELIELCGRLPLALRIAGSRLRHRPSWPVAHLNERLRARLLIELSGETDGVGPAFAVSYEQLNADQQLMFRRLSLMPGKDIDHYGAAALAGLTATAAEDVLESLVDASLLLQPRPGRFEFHDLLRKYSAQVMTTDDQSAEAINSLLQYYVRTARRSAAHHHDLLPDDCDRTDLDDPEVSQDLAWADAERTNLVAAVQLSEREGHDDLTVPLTIAVAPYLHLRTRQDELDVVLTAGLAAAQRGADKTGEARLLYLRGHIGQFRCGPAHGVCDLRRAAELANDESPALQSHILGSLGYTVGSLDLHSDWPDLLRESLRLAQLADDQRATVSTLGHLAGLHARQWNFAVALEYYEQALSMARALGDERLEPNLLNGMASCHLDAGNAHPALQAARTAQELAATHALEFPLSYALCHLGEAYRQLGWHAQAVETHRRALEIAVDNCTYLDEVDARLNLGRSLLTHGCQDQAEDQYQLVLRLCEDRQYPLGIAQALVGLADCHESLQPGEARGLLLRALAAVSDGVHPVLAGRLEDRLAAATSGQSA
ncbi:BTAD domain-containing putative transcriptional regulator [Kribbella sp. NPDC051718]|uniref:AfsR/SARP family transcriptional regulator n=1 Tax=Kribbella sp. NPDC051718 TaxID=3155168 RepID=UPI003440C403